MAKKLSSRGRALRWLSSHRGITEQPAGSNSDSRRDGIHAAQVRCANGGTFLNGAPWCGIWHFKALEAGKVKGISARQASVAFIEDDARAHRAPYGRGWTLDPRKVLRGDAAVMFGRGVHVATVRAVYPRLGLVRTDEGNTTSGNSGDQANGGGAFPRWRKLSDVHGFALADYPES